MGKAKTAGRAPVETFKASHRGARISARKARLVMDTIRGEPVEKALVKLQFNDRRASPMIRKVVESAVANAAQLSGVESEELTVYRAFVDEGPTMKRWRPRSMGRAFPRLKRTCHLSVVLGHVPGMAARGGDSKRPQASEVSSSAESDGGES